MRSQAARRWPRDGFGPPPKVPIAEQDVPLQYGPSRFAAPRCAAACRHRFGADGPGTVGKEAFISGARRAALLSNA
jgi:hypothetical protein